MKIKSTKEVIYNAKEEIVQYSLSDYDVHGNILEKRTYTPDDKLVEVERHYQYNYEYRYDKDKKQVICFYSSKRVDIYNEKGWEYEEPTVNYQIFFIRKQEKLYPSQKIYSKSILENTKVDFYLDYLYHINGNIKEVKSNSTEELMTETYDEDGKPIKTTYDNNKTLTITYYTYDNNLLVSAKVLKSEKGRSCNQQEIFQTYDSYGNLIKEEIQKEDKRIIYKQIEIEYRNIHTVSYEAIEYYARAVAFYRNRNEIIDGISFNYEDSICSKLEKASALGCPNAAYDYSLYYCKNKVESLFWAEHSLEITKDYLHLGRCYFNIGEYEMAISSFQKETRKLERAYALEEILFCYLKGYAVPKSPEVINDLWAEIEWFNDNGYNFHNDGNLGLYYLGKNEEKAIYWLEKELDYIIRTKIEDRYDIKVFLGFGYLYSEEYKDIDRGIKLLLEHAKEKRFEDFSFQVLAELIVHFDLTYKDDISIHRLALLIYGSNSYTEEGYYIDYELVEKGESHLSKLLNNKENNIILLNYIAIIYERAGKYEKALKFYKKIAQNNMYLKEIREYIKRGEYINYSEPFIKEKDKSKRDESLPF